MTGSSSSDFPGPFRLLDLSARLIDEAMADLGRWRRHPVWGLRAAPTPEWDARLHELGREWVATLATASRPNDGPDVLLATQIYQDGGHTALMGDLATALVAANGPGTTPPLVWITNLLGHNSKAPASSVLARLGPAASRVTVFGGVTPVEKLVELVRLMEEIRPRRLFLFHHPEDPLPVVAARPEWCGQRIVVHHADATPGFGLCLPEVVLIDLNPTAAAQSRLFGLDPRLLPLTSPDPGPRPASFHSDGRLVTATAARAHKLTTSSRPSYVETVPLVLQTTGGRHVHIGELTDEMLESIRVGVTRAGLPEDSFLYRKWVPSLPHALWEHHCDLYLASFPVDGARTNVEVAASATPHLRHVSSERKSSRPGGFPLDGGLTWTNRDDLREILVRSKDAGLLESLSRRIRSTYDQFHAPVMFAENLHAILRGEPGYLDPHAAERDRIARESHRRACLRAGDEPPVRPAET